MLRRTGRAAYAVVALSLLTVSGSTDGTTIHPLRTTECAGCEQCNDIEDLIVFSVDTDPRYEWLALGFYCPQNPLMARCDQLDDCEPEFARVVGRARQLAATRAAASLRILLNENERRFQLVPERSALQVLDCDGEHVIAQISLAPRLTEALAHD